MRLQSFYVLKSKKDPILNGISNGNKDEYFEEAKCVNQKINQFISELSTP